MSIQNVYFTTPSVISNIQNQVGTNPYFDTTTTAANLVKYVVTNPGTSATGAQIACPVGTGTATSGRFPSTTTSVDAFGTGALGYSLLVGNAFSGEQVFFSTGVCNSGSAPITQDTMMYLASSAKFFNSAVWMKILEERLMRTTDAVKLYVPQCAGWYYYFQGTGGTLNGVGATPTGQVTNSATGVPVWDSFTGPLNTGALDDINIGHCISLNIGFPNEPLTMPGNLAQAFYAVPNANPDWGLMCASKDYYDCYMRGIQYALAGSGPQKAEADPAALWTPFNAVYVPNILNLTGANTAVFQTGANTDQTLSQLKVLKSGAQRLAWKVGELALSPTTNIKSQRSLYASINYGLLGAASSVAVKRAGYSSLRSYLTTKILTPLGITNRDFFVMNLDAPTGPDGAVIADSQGRRPLWMCTGPMTGAYLTPSWTNMGVDPDAVVKADAGTLAYNSCYFNSQLPQDKSLLSINPVLFKYYSDDPWGWNLGICVVTNMKTWAKILSLFINKGKYNNQQVLARSTVTWSFNTCSAPGSIYDNYSATAQGQASPENRWVACQCFNMAGQSILADIMFDAATLPGISQTAMVMPWNTNLYFWAGATGSSWWMDIDSGFYILGYNGSSTFLNNSRGAQTTNAYNYIQQAM